MKKQVLLLFAALLFNQAAYSFSAVAPSGQTLYYSIIGSTSVEVVHPVYGWDSNKPTGNLVIPDNVTYSGTTYQVTSIGQSAFDDCSGLTSITIPTSVTNIGERAFRMCGLTSVSIPNSVTSIGVQAFCVCSGLTSVTIGTSVTSIGAGAFSGCRGLTSVTFNADSCTLAGSGASGRVFNFCTNITSFTFGSNVRVIPPYLCEGIMGLTSVTIPNSVTSIGESAFYNCSGLTSITIGNSVTSIGQSAFYNCSGLTSVTIPNSVTYIGDYSFSGCSGLTSVSFNADSCTSAGSIYSNRAFVNCTNITSFSFGSNVRVIPPYLCEGIMGLTSVTIPNSVTSIGGRAFYNCSGLTSITIGNSVTYIGGGAFDGCSGLTSVTIPNSVTEIGSGAFYGCSGLTAVHYNGTVGQWCGTTFGGGYSNPLMYAHRLYINNAEVTSASIPNTVTEIKPYTFYGWSGLTSLTIPNSVTSIGERAFYNCSGLTSITIGNSVTSIGQSAFYGCSGLTSLTIPNSVTHIRYSAFEDCSGLTSVTIGNSVTSIQWDAFKHCYGLTAVHYNGTIGQWCGTTFGDDDSNPLMYAHRLYINNAEVTSASIPNTVTEIKPYTFYGWSGLTSLTIPNSVTSIGQRAFSGCSGLTSVTIGNSVTIIYNSAFSGCSGLTSVNIPNSVYSIGNYAFGGCSGLTSMTFLGSMPPQQIGTNTFDGVPTDIPVYIPCGRLAYYVNQLPRFTNYIEHLYEFSAVSADESWGTVQVLTEPSCSNPNAVLNAVPANGYRFDHWSTGSTDNPYTLTVTNDTTVIGYFVLEGGGTEGIDEVGEDDIHISVSNGHINVEGVEEEEVQVYDITGRMVQNRSLPSGVYIVKIGTLAAHKVVVMR